MRVLLLTFYFPPDLCAGSFRASALIKALHEASGDGLRVDVMTTMPNRYHSHSNRAEVTEQYAGVKVRRIPLTPHQSGMVDQSRAFAAFAYAVLRETRGQRWDVVVATSSRLMTGVLGALVARRSRIPLYLDIRDLFTDTMADLFSGSPIRGLLPIFRGLERWALQSASRVNLVSAGFSHHAAQIAPWHDYRFFTNGIDDDFLSLDFAGNGLEIGLPPLVVYAGNMGEGQGLHHVMPEAARLLTGKARFRLIGDGGRRGQLEEVLARIGVSNVEIIDPVPRSELYQHYREADVLLMHLNDHAAFRKVLPSKLFEYAATGKPMLAGVGGYAAEFLRQNVAGVEVFSPCDAGGMAKALERLLYIPGPVDREVFKQRFARKRIMREMAEDILSLGLSDGW